MRELPEGGMAAIMAVAGLIVLAGLVVYLVFCR
jgi:hypothetical protein